MKLTRFNFPGGEVHIKIEGLEGYNDCGPVQLTASLKNSDDILALLLQTDALRRSGIKDIHLVMPYIPYARQDRVMVPGEPLSIKVFCDLINSQKYSGVQVWDPHSDVAAALLDNCNVIPQHVLLKDVAGEDLHDNTVLVCPDAGARKKIGLAAKELALTRVLYADKKRDVCTGKILETVISSYPDQWDTLSDHLIVDDIADGGATFIELAKVLKDKGVQGKLSLYVTHGIFSKGLEQFMGLFDYIYMAHTWLSQEYIQQINYSSDLQVSVGWYRSPIES